MDLILTRTYDAAGGGTNGDLYLHVCSTIELPWLDNARNRSCIPEGRYALQSRFSAKHRSHFLVKEVPDRDGILIHPANDALSQLQGCIAPVTALTGAGRGTGSLLANEKLKTYLAPAILDYENIYLTIKKQTL